LFWLWSKKKKKNLGIVLGNIWQWEVHDSVLARRNSGEVLDRPIEAMTGVETKTNPNS
jgi:hypothetical protein